MVILTVVFCMQLNPTMCRTLEMVPVDHAMTSVMECIRGGAIGGVQYEQQQFKLEGVVWRVRRYRCEERPSAVRAWVQGKQR
jgi:hypothetical protein